MGPMVPVELQLLLAAVIIGLVQIIWAAAAGSGGERDFAWLSGPRDEAKPVNTVAGRLNRALANFLETFPMFVAAILACDFAGKFGPLTMWGAVLYVVGRALYVPVYAAGISMVRTLVWAVSLVGLIMVIAAFFR
jgi:uncharacterized MAPEG superfamily protein